MDKIFDDIVNALAKELLKEGKRLDENAKKMIKNSLKAQFGNMQEDQRNNMLGLIASQLRRL
jgi:hypothetical protein